MKREDFIKWIDGTCFEKRGEGFYRELVDYAEYDWNELEVYDDKVLFTWEEKYWGGRSTENREFSFEDFIEKYNDGNLKW